MEHTEYKIEKGILLNGIVAPDNYSIEIGAITAPRGKDNPRYCILYGETEKVNVYGIMFDAADLLRVNPDSREYERLPECAGQGKALLPNLLLSSGDEIYIPNGQEQYLQTLEELEKIVGVKIFGDY